MCALCWIYFGDQNRSALAKSRLLNKVSNASSTKALFLSSIDCDISFLLSFISFLLSGDPLTHERRAMTELDALALTAAQKANHLDVHQGHFVQVQHDGVSIALDLRPEVLEMFRLDPAAEPEDRVLPVRDLLTPERHSNALRTNALFIVSSRRRPGPCRR